MLPRKESGLIIVSSLAAHRYGSVEIELQIIRRLDKLFQLIHILELGIAVEQQCCVIGSCFVMIVELFKILNQVVYPLSVQELS